MKQQVNVGHRILLLIYYCIRLATQLFSVRKNAFPDPVKPSDQFQARKNRLETLKGQTIQIHGIEVDNTYSGWPEGISPDLERLRHVSDEKLQKLIVNKSKLAKFKRADFGLSAAMWWPYAKFDEAVVLLHFVIWLFTWDDDIDEEGGSVYDDFQAAESRRQETLKYVTYCLGFKVAGPYKEPNSPLILDFKGIGDALCQAYTVDQRQRFLKEMKTYIEGSRVEQEMRMSGRILTIDEYWDHRFGSSAVDLTSSVIEFSTRSSIPKRIFKDTDMINVWRETNIIISASNDMFSIKKEMKSGQVDTLIPLLCFNKGIQVQQAMDEADAIVRSAKARFDKAAESLAAKYADDLVIGRQIREFIDGCKYNMTGNHNWSLISSRYGLGGSRRGNTLVFTL